MLKRNLLLFALFFLLAGGINAQKRYLEPVFDDVNVQTLIYGYNWSIITVPTTGNALFHPLVGDLYTPVGDSETARPLVLYFHSGNFLPHPQNGSVSGTRTDSTVVEMCRRLAKMGYVVASLDHRLGWNPIASTQEERVNTLINAAYRGVQDARSAIRFFKENAAAMGIDSNKVVLFGQGTGGYISLNTGVLDSYGKVVTTQFPEDKFRDGNGIPFVIESINGNIWGTSFGVVNFPGHPLDGDTLCVPNNVGPSSDFQLMVNLGGAMGDLSWLDANSPAVISMQSPTDPFAPYNSGILIVPGFNLNVVEVQGSFAIQTKAKELGINAAFEDVEFVDPISVEIASKNGGLAGLYPIQRPADAFLDSSPYDFWDPSNVNHAAGLQTNPDMSREKAYAYMDTIISFYAPRACLVLGLDCDLSGHLSNKTVPADVVSLSVAPNPAYDFVAIKSDKNMIKGIVVYDASGRAVKAVGDINSYHYQLNRENLPEGVYYAQVRFEKEVATVRFMFGK